MASSRKKTKKMGRPPAKWVYELAELDMPDDAYLSYEDISKMFGVSIGAVKNFCSRNDVKGEYSQENFTVKKKFKVKNLKKSGSQYIDIQK